MKFDRNTIVGFLILAALFIGYFYYTSKGQEEAQRLAKIEKAKQDSIIRANIPKTDSLTQKVDSATAEANKKIAAAGNFQTAANGEEKLLPVENDVMRITFTSKGGQIKMVELKKYKGQDSNWVKLGGTDFDKFSYTINTGTPAKPSVGQTGELFFNPGTATKNADGSTVVSFVLSSADTSSSSTITHTYTIKKDDYMIDFTAGLKGANTLLTQGNMNVTWQYTVEQQESDISFERTNTQMGYVENGEFDYNTIGRRSSVSFNKSTDWIGLRQRFFFGAIVSKNPAFASGKMEWTEPAKNGTIAEVISTMKVQVPVASDATAHFSIYYGPSDYQTLKKYDLELNSEGTEITHTYDSQGNKTGIAALLEDLHTAKIKFKDMETKQSSLEEIFVSLVRKPS